MSARGKKKAKQKSKAGRSDKAMTVPVASAGVALTISAPAVTLFYQDMLLEPSRTKWQYGEWHALIALDPVAVQRDQERGKLMLLVAAAHSHFGNGKEAMAAARQAVEWGCDRRLLARVLISAVSNSLGRAAASLDDPSAGEHFQEAIRLVEPRADVRLLGRTRQIRETARLGLLPEAGRLIDADLTEARAAPADHSARLTILDTELELLRGEISVALTRSQIFRDTPENLTPESPTAPADPAPPAALAPSAGLASRSVSQLGQDLWVLEKTRHKRGGYFVDFGATDGVALNNTLLLETEFGWTGLCAEPNPKFFADLRRNRRCIVSDACIGPRSGDSVEFIFADVFGGIADYADADSHAAKRHAYRAEGRVARLTTLSLEDFLLTHGAPHDIDYLSIDTEGSEYDILAAFPFDRWRIRLITVEHNFTPLRARIHALLSPLGYTRTEAQWDDWYALAE